MYDSCLLPPHYLLHCLNICQEFQRIHDLKRAKHKLTSFPIPIYFIGIDSDFVHYLLNSILIVCKEVYKERCERKKL